MPYKTEKQKIDCPFMDRRTKLLPCQKEMVVHYHNLGYSQRKIASMFNVSRRLVIFVIHPERLKKNLEARHDRGGWKVYYDTQKNNKYQREHRAYKHKTIKDAGQNRNVSN